MELLRCDEWLRRLAWQEPEQVAVPRVSKDDCLVVCAGFEERSVEVLRRTVELKPARVVLISYRPRYEENRHEEMYRIVRGGGIDLLEVMYDRRNPAGIGDQVAVLVRGFGQVFVDVSGMSRFLIVQTLVALLSEIKSLVVLYSEAETYYPTRKTSKSGPSGGQLSDIVELPFGWDL